jgi:putative SOS response-associated peptidase YedK
LTPFAALSTPCARRQSAPSDSEPAIVTPSSSTARVSFFLCPYVLQALELMPADSPGRRHLGKATKARPGQSDRGHMVEAAMCGRYTNTKSKSDDLLDGLADRLGVEMPASERGFERFNIAPTQQVLAAVDDSDGRQIELLRWGLVPSWSKELKTRFAMINARAETLHEKPAYRSLVAQTKHRCLVLADGYYEWQKPEDPRQPRRPMHYSLQRGEPFCFAGLWTRWTSPEGDVVPSCTIVTCQANELTRPIHDRMPVMLADPEAWEAWLDPALAREDAGELLVPLPSERMVVRAANPIVNSARHEGPDCLAALAA